ncbi:hypothetical protein [Sphingomonas pituitosa]|uniref:hypothetical protein n=1 Tax=Sphingomonas pituitosa TaxID=99597 RepID=UPI000836B220|nr:hypothetical protein [Sphingomonas pituitosa]
MNLKALSEHRYARFLPAAILALGFFIRLLRPLTKGVQYAMGEAPNAALSWARDGTIADVFARGSGLTTHINPILPMFAGTIYRLFGVRSAPSEWILALIAISIAIGTAALFYRAAALSGIPRPPRLAGLAIFALIPIYPDLETTVFRIWEGGLAMLLGTVVLLLTLRADAGGQLTYRSTFFLGLTGALLFFINPALGLAGYAMIGLLLLRKAPLRSWIAHGALLAALLVAVLAPWTIRNYEVFGRFLPLRGNFGLELAIGNHPAALGSQDREIFTSRLRTIHPLESQAAFDRMQAMGGELVYANAMGDAAKAWIRAHPGDFARLCVKHAFQYYFPPRWQWAIYTEKVERSVPVRQALLWTFTALGLVGAFAALFTWRTRLIYLAAMAVVPVLPYIVTQPVPRYRYIVMLPLLFLGMDMAYKLYRKLRPAPAETVTVG